MKARRLAELSVLTALALIIFVIELQIPTLLPIPGIKLGLANVVTVYAVYRYRWYEVCAVVLVRVALGSVFSGNMMALIYSLAGSAMCLIGMLLLKRIIDARHMMIASVFGAVLHNTGQMLAAFAVTRTAGIWAYYPFLLVAGCIAGALTGLLAQIIFKRTENVKR